MTLRRRLTLAFVLVLVVPLAAAGVIVARGVPSALDSAAADRLASARAGVAALVRESCDEARLTAELLGREARTVGAAAATRDVVGRGLAGYAAVSRGVAGTFTSAGHLSGVAGTPTPQQLGSCSRGTPAAAALPAIADSVEVQDASGTTMATAAVAVPLDATAVKRLAAASDAQVTLVAGRRALGSTLPPATAQAVAAVAAPLARSGERRQVHGMLSAAVSVGTQQPVVVVSVDRPGIGAINALVAAVLLVSLLAALLVGWWLARLITGPLTELAEGAGRVAAGDLDSRIPVRSRDEVGRLAATFNHMTDELRGYVGALQSSRDELRRNLARLGETLTSTHDLQGIVEVIAESAVASVRAGAGEFWLRVDGTQELALQAVHGHSDGPGSRLGRRVPLGMGLVGAVAVDGKPVWGEQRRLPYRPAPGERTGAAVLAVPLRTGRGVLGVLVLHDRLDGQPFDQSDVETIQAFAAQAGVAIDNVLLHQEAQQLSFTDGLTGLANYRFFHQTLAKEIERAARFHRPLALLMFDLDRFKLVNDEHGHQVGDAVLVEVAHRVRSVVREVDLLARYGGEEFVVVLPETDRDGAAHSAERICAQVRARPVMGGGGLEIPITVSVGGAVFPGDGDTTTALIRSADQALYAAKGAGRDGWRLAPAR